MVIFFGLVIAFVVSFFIYSDAEARGMNAVGWALACLALMIVFLPLYLIVRKPFKPVE